MRWLFGTNRSWVLLLQRLVLAVVIFPHGAQKLLGWFGGDGFSATVSGFGQLGIPAVVTVLIILTETAGTIALALGFLSRVVALGILCIMIGAVAMLHAEVGFFMNWSGQLAGEGFEYHLLAAALAIPLIVLGGGRWSVDGLLVSRRAKRTAAVVPSPGR